MKIHPRFANPRKSKRTPAIGGWLAIASILVGCVTVNVNFPESAVQKATDDYVRDIYRTKAPKASPSATESSTSSQLWNVLVPAAVAAEEFNFQLTSPKMDSIKSKLKGRVSDIIEQKKAGVLGETNDGRLIIKDPAKLKPLLKKKIEDLLADENKDRAALYDETIAIPSNHLTKANLPQVKRSFTRSFQAESPSGTWVQSADGAWAQKP